MSAAVLLKQFESILGGPLGWQSRPEPEVRAHRHFGNRFGHRRTAPRMPYRDRRPRILRPHQSAARDPRRRHRAPGGLRAGGCRGCLLPALRRRCRRATGAPALGALRAQRRARAQSGRSADPGRRLRPGGHGSGRYAAADRAPHLADFLVPPAPRGGTYPDRAGLSGAAIECQDLRVAGDRMRAQGDNLVRRASVSRLLRGIEVRATSTQRRKQCSPVFTARAI